MMHDLDRTQLETYETFEATPFGYAGESGVFGEADEIAMATELLGVSTEEELDQFLGDLVKKVGGVVGKIARGPIGGLLKGVAKKILPMAGGALGSFIPIPGVGTAVGTALGNAAANMFEVNLEGMNQEDQEFDIARRFVRLAGDAAAKAANAGPAAATPAGAKAALVEAARTHAPGLARMLTSGGMGIASPAGVAGRTGRWIRRGRHILVLGA
jgi:uncharacterized protein (DUF697 family)